MTLTKTFGRGLAAATAALLLFSASGCGDDDASETGGGDGDGDSPVTFVVTLENDGAGFRHAASGVFNTPRGADGPGPLVPGDSYEVTFFANPGHRLSLVTMFIPSNDFFYAPDGEGIALFDGAGAPITGDVTDQIELWDAGTEEDQRPGVGADQPQRSPNTGAADPNATVRLAADAFDNLPAVDEVIEVSLAAEVVNGAYQFTATITNVSTGTTLNGDQAVPLSPGAYAVHSDSDPLFSVGASDFGAGVEAIAEEGNPAELAASLAPLTGLTLLSSPGVWATTRSASLLFEAGSADYQAGLQAIAEDGNPGALSTSLAADPNALTSGVFNTAVGADGPGPLAPGSAYRFEFTAEPGDRLSLASMLVPSNDWIITDAGGTGIALFDESGIPVAGDFSALLGLYDAGTEVDQELGFGLDQVQNQSGPDTGADDANTAVRGLGLDHNFVLTIETAP